MNLDLYDIIFIVAAVIVVFGALNASYDGKLARGLMAPLLKIFFPKKKKGVKTVKYKGVFIDCQNPIRLKRIKKNIDTWIVIHEDQKCPDCGADDPMMRGPSGGLATNIKCDKCGERFWTTPVKALGAYNLKEMDRQP